ncbi:MAG TPA: hypothetical protein VMU84_07325 [Thermoanaerobaculia bacterium]|nr:hypothetical protein [Thermoanaerobaculia bacterium]
MLSLFAGASPPQSPPAAAAEASVTAPPVVAGVHYKPIDPAFFKPKAVVQGWIDTYDNAKISQHRWDLWRYMNMPSHETIDGTDVPIWETWYSGTEVYLDVPFNTANTPASCSIPPTVHPRRRFERPHQHISHGVQPDVVLASFNRFTKEMYEHVRRNGYYRLEKLLETNAAFPATTPIQDRNVKNFPDKSIMLKPVFIPVSSTTPTMVPYWNGITAGATTDPTNPTSPTWTQCVLVDPTGTATNNQDRVCNPSPQPGLCGDGGSDPPCGNTLMPAGTYKVIRISDDPAKSDVYAFKMTQDEVNQLGCLGMGPLNGPYQAGDYAMFVATHTSTREVDNWTWQTFWWQPVAVQLSEPPLAELPPASAGITGAWKNYASCYSYYFAVPNNANGQPVRCYNPYLETALGGLGNLARTTSTGVGVDTSCIACHRAASLPNAAGPPPGYITYNYLSAADPIWFKNTIKTDFLWSIPVRAHNAPYTGLP